MQKLLAALVAAGMLAVAAPVNANTSDKNVEWMLNFAGFDTMPVGVATLVVNGEVTQVTIEEAFRLAAARAGDVDLGAIAAGAAPGDAQGVGDVWAFEFGTGDCPEITAAETPVPFVPIHPQLWIYSGGAGFSQTTGAGIILDWTTKLATGGFYGDGMTYGGQSDFFCFGFWGFYILFPFIDGFAASN